MSTPGPRPGRCRAGQWMLQAQTTQLSRLRAMIWTLFHLPSLPGDARWPRRQIFSLDGISSPVAPKELQPETLSFGPRKEGGGEETEHTHRPMYTHRPMCIHQTRAHTCTYVGMYAHLHKRDTCTQPTHTRHMCTSTFTQSHKYVYMCAHEYTCVCVCRGTRACTQRHTCVHTHRSIQLGEVLALVITSVLILLKKPANHLPLWDCG